MKSHKPSRFRSAIDITLFTGLVLFVCACSKNEVVPVYIDGEIVVSQKVSQFQIGILDKDGNHLLTSTNVDNRHNLEPRWSPDGSRIAYIFGGLVYSRDEIHVMNSDGSDNVTIKVDAYDLDWSADGSKIIFNDYIGRIKSISPDGSDLTTYDVKQHLHDIDCSNDGSRIAFNGQVEGSNFDIFVMNTDGSGLINITKTPDWETEPKWSPDDSQIAFASEGQIFVIDSDGSNKRQLTYFDTKDNREYGHSPTWSPNGKQIAYIDLLHGVYVMDSDGSNIIKVSDIDASSLDWH